MRDTIIRYAAAAGIAAAFTVSSLNPAEAQAPSAPHNTCFYSSEFENWKAPDARTLYIRVGLHRFFRLDLAADCNSLLWPGSHLITEIRGSETICSALDWDLKVSQGTHDIAEACIVKTMTELSPTESDAIPKKFKP
jgi:hypothetical protein